MRIVVKVGTTTLAHSTGNLNIRRVEELCKVLSDLKNAGHEVVLVSSGAIGMGLGKLSMKKKPEDIPTKQACAAVGQCELMYTYDKLFSEYNHIVGQILVTGEDIKNPVRHQNFQNTVYRLLELGALPIINENDSVATEEIIIGDNDTLSAVVAQSVDADLLVILTDIDGFYTANPHEDKDAELIKEVVDIDAVEAMADDTQTKLGTGGMKTKLLAARIAVGAGMDMVIINGKRPELLYNIASGNDFVGTRFIAKK
ncbi:MAG: glutamate 5-kinase [Ruminococcaceae bacterium]|nr:glutamate 5-kinase [Oscillospiraceae bacterium]